MAPGDIQAMAQKTIELLSDPARLQAERTSAQRHSQQFNWPKIAEATQRMDALLTYSTGENGEHLVMSGILTIVEDRDKLHGLWSTGADMYFPKGPDDPAAVLLRFEPFLAEYWKHGGAGAINFVFQYAKAKLTGNRARLGDHGRVAL